LTDPSPLPRRCRPAQTVVDGPAKAGIGHRGKGDAALRSGQGIGLAQDVEQVRRRLDQIAVADSVRSPLTGPKPTRISPVSAAWAFSRTSAPGA
jgi:hypothetical protein